MRSLEDAIVDDAATIDGEKWIIYLGDYIDRGKDSAGVLDFLLARAPKGFRRFCLVGNHEVMALSFLQNPQAHSDWLGFGGHETLYSYGLSATALQGGSARNRHAVIESHVPAEHMEFLAELPLSISVPGNVFVHAGIRQGVPMPEQVESDLLWIRDAFFEAPPTPGLRVVHGHTPNAEPVVTENRICVDTGAFATGVLTAARLTPDGGVKMLQTIAR
jgi:serine/threonine protein phosphatase 1